MKSFAGIVFIFLVAFVLILFPILGQASDYTFIDLGVPDGWTSSYAYGINDLGEVVGAGYTDSGIEHAFIWKEGVFKELHPPDWENSKAWAINNSGVVVGDGCKNPETPYWSNAFLWDGNSFTDLNPAGWVDSAAYGINASGIVVGNGWNSNYKTLRWEDGAFTNLGVPIGWKWSEAQDINNLGYIVGHGGIDFLGNNYAFLWIDGHYINLTPSHWSDPYVYVYGINDRENIVGYGKGLYGDVYHAMLWEALEKGDFRLIDLHPNGWELSYAYDINNSGVVVGWGRTASSEDQALLWDGNSFTNLHPEDWIASRAQGINQSGVVVGYGANPYGLTRAFMAIKNQPPIAHAGGPYIGHEGDEIIFDASESYDPDEDQLLYRWDFNNDGVWDTEWIDDPIVIQIWDDDWTGIVRLEVSDGVLTAIDAVTVTVNNVSPSVDVGHDLNAECCKDQFAFSGGFFDPGLLDTHTIEWDFGDDCTATGSLNPNHKYCLAGEYTVTLTVTDDDGGVGYDTLIVTVDDALPPEVNISSPEGIIYNNTQGSVEIIYTVQDLCDSHPGINVFLDGEAYNEASLDLSVYLDESEHTLSVQAADASGNIGKDSVTFVVIPKPMESFVIDKMKIRWAHDHPWKHWVNKTSFVIFGSFELPDGYLREDFSRSALIYIQIANQRGVDRVAFKGLKRLWIYRESSLWRHKGGDCLGEGIDIQAMMIHWPDEGKFNFKGYKKKSKRHRFYIKGELFLNAIDMNALPNEAKIILEFPVSPYEKGGSLSGKETIEFETFHHTWFYHAPIYSK